MTFTIRVNFKDGSSIDTKVSEPGINHPNDALKWLGSQLAGASVSGLMLLEDAAPVEP